MCVVNKQFELLEFVSESVYVDLQYDEISLTFTAGPVCLCGVSHHAHHCTACESIFTYCTLNRVCLHSFPTDTTVPLSRVYNHLPTTSTNHHFRLSRIHLQSFVKKASSPFSPSSAKLLHCWCHSISPASVLTTV